MNEEREVLAQHRMCRVFGHAWDYTTVDKKGQELVQGLVCIRCETERYIKVNSRTGETNGGRYRYADGYLFKGGGSLTINERAELRLVEVAGHLPRQRRAK